MSAWPARRDCCSKRARSKAGPMNPSGDATDTASSNLRIKLCRCGGLHGEVVIDDDGELLKSTGESQCSETMRSTVVLQELQNMLTDSVSRTATNSDTTSRIRDSALSILIGSRTINRCTSLTFKTPARDCSTKMLAMHKTTSHPEV